MMVRMSVVDDRVRSAASQWGLTVGEELSGGARSAVFAATDELGRDLVLKLPARRAATGDPTQAEAAALRSWAGTGAAVELVAATVDALLLARARPGLQQPWRPEGRLEDTVGAAGELLRRLWLARQSSSRYPALSSVYAEDERVAREDAGVEQRNRGEPDRGVPGLRRLPAAAAAIDGDGSSCDPSPWRLHHQEHRQRRHRSGGLGGARSAADGGRSGCRGGVFRRLPSSRHDAG